MITYSIQAFGALINSGFNRIFPFAVQLPHRVDMDRSEKLKEKQVRLLAVINRLNLSNASLVNFSLAFFKYHFFTNNSTLFIS